MGSAKIYLFLAVIISMVGSAYPAAGGLADVCTVAGACTDTANHVCDTTASQCRVKADETATDCASTNSNCPTDATCGTDTCSCDAGFIVVASGLCTVQNAVCSGSVACGDTTNFVCESGFCKVLADASATDCGGLDTNCPVNAACAGDGTCSCNAGYTVVSDLCTAVIGMTCTTNSDCSTALTNTECNIVSPCSQGTCVCSSGYTGTPACTTLEYDTTCSTGTDNCGTALSCDGTTLKCACSAVGHTYKSDVSDCTDKMVFGGTCSVVGDCYTTTNGDCINSQCDCASNYIKDTAFSGSQSCRLPYVNEACSSTCAKITTTALLSAGETSQATPSCTSSQCACAASGETLYSRMVGSVCYNYCLTDFVGTESTAGTTCTAFNECASKICAQCPGDANAKCYDAGCSAGVQMTANRIALCLSILLLSYFF